VNIPWPSLADTGMGSGVVSNVVPRVGEIGVKQHAVAPISNAGANGGNRVRDRQHVSKKNDNGDNHDYNHVKEVINDDEHPEFPAATGRLKQLVNPH